MKHPKEHRQKVYHYVEGLLGRPLTFEKHNNLHDLMTDYTLSATNLQAVMQRVLCAHKWVGATVVEGGPHARAHMKCAKCDKRTLKRMPTIIFDA